MWKLGPWGGGSQVWPTGCAGDSSDSLRRWAIIIVRTIVSIRLGGASTGHSTQQNLWHGSPPAVSPFGKGIEGGWKLEEFCPS